MGFRVGEIVEVFVVKQVSKDGIHHESGWIKAKVIVAEGPDGIGVRLGNKARVMLPPNMGLYRKIEEEGK